MTAENRAKFVNYFINEVLGPTIPAGEDAFTLPPADAAGLHHIPEDKKTLKLVDPDTNELIVLGSAPANIYGTGVLHSPEAWEDDASDSAPTVVSTVDVEILEEHDDVPEVDVTTVGGRNYESDGETFALDQSQIDRPRAMGLTFQPDLQEGDTVSITFSGAVYEQIKLMIGDRGPIQAWKRKVISGSHELVWQPSAFKINSLYTLALKGEAAKYIGLKLRLRNTFIKNQNIDGLTATLVAKNLATTSKEPDVFQSQLTVTIVGQGRMTSAVKPESVSAEQQELDHLYRHAKNYGTGHGTSVSWREDDSGEVRTLKTEAIPSFYQEVLDFDTVPNISMKQLASDSRAQINALLSSFIDGYKTWILTESEASMKDAETNSAVVERLSSKARHLLERITEGYELVCKSEDTSIFEAFQLANQAMFEQQKNGKRKVRKWARGEKGAAFSLAESQEPVGNFGNWRPFQVAFLLAVIPGIVDGANPSREEIDIIFFPTGGGKTEAYLGASAFTILHRRLSNDATEVLGVDVLMRYTLRLLTIQQFERSAGLITALEMMRQKNPQKLGLKPISIGVWLGADTTPNWRKDGYGLLKDIKDRKEDDPNPFILSKCPVCAAEFGWDAIGKKWWGFAKVPKTGSSATIRFVCSDRDCEFGDSENPLPIFITDEDVYEEKPSFILGTVDKFAQMAWRAEAKSLFNIDETGVRKGPPPALIIQDELHLISGPLGSMVGLYEPVIEELCTDRRVLPAIRPKIVASTATTRNYEAQILGLYGRPSVALFPQAINRANETYFSRIARDKVTGEKELGSLYLGVHPATYGSSQTSAARIAAILKQAPNMVPDVNDKGMDYYRTSLWFFNSLKELGMTLTLMQSTTRDMIGGMRSGHRLPDGAPSASYPHKILELTSRIDSNKVSDALRRLGIPSAERDSFDTCLASSIMEVGVDVPRLGLLTIMAQPKTTAQYIQVSGRVGRDRANGPGLVVMLYNTKRSRDRSVYERFQSYHETLYAQVEPISVTPFSVQAMQHGLKGAIIAMYRMSVPNNARPDDVDWQKFDEAVEILRSRITQALVGEQSLEDFEKQVSRLKSYWKSYPATEWGYSYREQYKAHDPATVAALMRGRREPLAPLVAGDKSIMVMTSMRSVDGQTNLEIAAPYAFIEGED